MANIKFRGGTSEILSQEFTERTRYRQEVSFEGMLDTWYEKPYYGLVNSNFEPVILVCASELATGQGEDLEEIILENISNVSQDLRALNFVVDAFNAFRSDYSDLVQNTNVNYPRYLTPFAPAAAYTSFKEQYRLYSAGFLIDSYVANLDLDPKLYNLSYRDLVYEIFDMIRDSISEYPVTKSGYLLSKYSDIKSTGLVIELADLPGDRDDLKSEILSDPNFKCYVDYATSAGFYVDKNVPWRLCMNLDSEMTRLTIRNENLETQPDGTRQLPQNEGSNISRNSSAEEIFNSIYRVKTHYEDLLSLIVFMNLMYAGIRNSIELNSSMVYIVDQNLETDLQISIGEATVHKKEWLRMLLEIRLLEIEAYSEQEFLELASRVEFIYDNYGQKQAEGKIGKICAEKLKEKYERAQSNTNTGY